MTLVYANAILPMEKVLKESFGVRKSLSISRHEVHVGRRRNSTKG